MKIIIALLIFSLIVIIHEFGHFLLAKKNGIKVTEFSLGMGPRILSHQGKETRYSVKLFPIGGSCMMLGEDELVEDDSAFNKKGVWARISVVAAGPIFNFILAFLLSMFVIAAYGYDPATITDVVDGYPAQEAGLRPGDLITEINGSSVDVSRDIYVYLQFHPLENADPIDIRYERDGESYDTTLTPVLYKKYRLGFSYTADETKAKLDNVEADMPLAKAGLKSGDVITAINQTSIKSGSDMSQYFSENPLTDQAIEITYERDGKSETVSVTPSFASESYSWGFTYNEYRTGRESNPLTVIKYSYYEVKYWIRTTIGSLGQMIRGNVSTDDIAGPVGIVDMIGDSYDYAKEVSPFYTIVQMAYICILLSANLGVMNLLPLPALDGGRLVFLLIEVVRGKPIDQQKEGMVHLVGLIALMLLMIFVLFNDLSNIFG